MNTPHTPTPLSTVPAGKKQLNLYFTAGIPQLDSTGDLLKLLQDCGADRVEIGMPYSDPVADGEVIQKAHQKALKNGMTISILLEQLKAIKKDITIPIVLMGYINPVLSFGFERFCKECADSGVKGLIIPDLPALEFEKSYGKILKSYELEFSFLITPETPTDRIHYLDSLSSGFLYAVSSSSTTGKSNNKLSNEAYFQKLSDLQLTNPIQIGFGIQTKADFETVTRYSAGGIIGTALVKILLENENWKEKVTDFIQSIKCNLLSSSDSKF